MEPQKQGEVPTVIISEFMRSFEESIRSERSHNDKLCHGWSRDSKSELLELGGAKYCSPEVDIVKYRFDATCIEAFSTEIPSFKKF